MVEEDHYQTALDNIIDQNISDAESHYQTPRMSRLFPRWASTAHQYIPWIRIQLNLWLFRGDNNSICISMNNTMRGDEEILVEDFSKPRRMELF